MQVAQTLGIFNNQDSTNLKNKTLFSNILNNIDSIVYNENIDLQEGLNFKYNKQIKNPHITYMEVNSNAILSMRNSMKNEIVPVDIKRVNAVLAYTA